MFFEASLRIGQRLTEREETVSVAESSTGGLISANLLSVPGASRYFQGGSIVYTLASRRAYLDLEKSRVEGLQPLTQAMVLEFARAARLKLNTTWGIAELRLGIFQGRGMRGGTLRCKRYCRLENNEMPLGRIKGSPKLGRPLRTPQPRRFPRVR